MSKFLPSRKKSPVSSKVIGAGGHQILILFKAAMLF